MKLTSNWSTGKVFWRTFNFGDTVYLTGNREGFLSNGESVSDINHPSGHFQMEIKRGDIFGSFLIHAGSIFNNEDEFILTDQGTLVTEEEFATVEIDHVLKLEYVGSSSQFFSLLNSSVDSEYEITASITQNTDVAIDNKSTITTSATNSDGTKADGGASVDAGTKTDPIKPSIKIDGQVSHSVENKIVTEVEKALNFKFSTATTYTEKHKAFGKARMITVYTYSWQRQYYTGKVTLGSNVIPFDATKAYITSEQRVDYASVAALPADLFAIYNNLFPSSPGNPLPVPKKLVINKKNLIVGLGDKCIDAAGASSANGTSIVLWEQNGGINQMWGFDGEFIMSSMDTNKCLDVQSGVADNGTPIILWEKNGGDNQKWIYNAADGSFTSFLDPNKCIDVRGVENKNGAVIQLWEKNGGANQKWNFV